MGSSHSKEEVRAAYQKQPVPQQVSAPPFHTHGAADGAAAAADLSQPAPFPHHTAIHHSHQPPPQNSPYRGDHTPQPAPAARDQPQPPPAPHNPRPQQPPPPPTATSPFPPAFTVWKKKSGKFVIGPSRARPQFVATASTILHNKVDLYAGPSAASPLIASVRAANFCGNKMEIITQDGSGLSALMRSGDMERWKLTIGGGPDTFVWEAAEVADLAGMWPDAKKGWKLVRRADGVPVVLVGAETRRCPSSVQFAFVNEGASGQLGPQWAAVAVASFVELWYVKIQKTIAEAIGGAGEVAGAAFA